MPTESVRTHKTNILETTHTQTRNFHVQTNYVQNGKCEWNQVDSNRENTSFIFIIEFGLNLH